MEPELDRDLDDPKINNLTTPDLDGDDIEVVEPVEDNTRVPSEPSAHNYQPGQDKMPAGPQTRDPAEGATEVPAPAEAQPE